MQRGLFWLGWKDSNLRNDGVRVRCLTTWRHPNIGEIGWDRWIRTIEMTESKSVALPLGYTPSSWRPHPLFILFSQLLYYTKFNRKCQYIAYEVYILLKNSPVHISVPAKTLLFKCAFSVNDVLSLRTVGNHSYRESYLTLYKLYVLLAVIRKVFVFLYASYVLLPAV